jgi:hypothetical protein
MRRWEGRVAFVDLTRRSGVQALQVVVVLLIVVHIALLGESTLGEIWQLGERGWDGA